jgi:guanylate kinase
MSPAKLPGHLFIISGASGTGKTTLSRALENDLGLHFSISATTRSKRAGEEDGRDYRFLSLDNFKRMIREGEFLEWAVVHGNYYGTPRDPIEAKLREGESVLLDLDTQGALKLKKDRKDAILIFIRPPSLEALRERLENRGTDSEEVMEKRIKKAAEEIAQSDQYDHVLINEDLKDTQEELRDLIKSYLN